MEEKGINCPLRQEGQVLSRFGRMTDHQQALSPGSPHSQLPKLRPEDEMDYGTRGQKNKMCVCYTGKQTD